MPEVSVVMPVRDVAATVDPAVRSILAQSFEDWELVVVDDGSTDATPQLMAAWAARDDRVKLHVERRSAGLATRLNQSIRLSRGSFIARMDGDDVSYPQRLATQIAYLKDHPDVDVVGAGAMVFRSGGAPRGCRTRAGEHELLTARALREIPLMHPTWMGRRRWFLAHSYDRRARCCEDQELLLRACSSSRYAALPDVLIGYREDRIKLRSSLVARLNRSVFVLRYGLRQGVLPGAFAALGRELVAGTRDAVAVALRCQQIVLARRTRVPALAETAEWTALWRRLTSTAWTDVGQPRRGGPGDGKHSPLVQ